MTDIITVDIMIDCPDWLENVEKVEDLCRSIAMSTYESAAKPVAGSLVEASIVLADDAFVQNLNRTYRSQDRPTNVLSFAALDDNTEVTEPVGGHLLLGDIIVAFGVASREAKEQEKNLADHVSHLIAHGMLHLLGYDHEEQEAAEEMEDLERDVLARHGIRDPYADNIAKSKQKGVPAS